MADKDETGRDAYEREVTTDLKDTTPDRPKGMPLHTRILIGLLAGVVAGVAANRIWGGDHAGVAWTISRITEPIGTLFLRLLLMIVVPLVFSSLVVGVAGIGDIPTCPSSVSATSSRGVFRTSSNSTSSGTTSGRFESVCGQMGVMTTALIEG